MFFFHLPFLIVNVDSTFFLVEVVLQIAVDNPRVLAILNRQHPIEDQAAVELFLIFAQPQLRRNGQHHHVGQNRPVQGSQKGNCHRRANRLRIVHIRQHGDQTNQRTDHPHRRRNIAQRLEDTDPLLVAFIGQGDVFLQCRPYHIGVMAIHQQVNAFAQEGIVHFHFFEREEATFTGGIGHLDDFSNQVFRVVVLEHKCLEGNFRRPQKLADAILHQCYKQRTTEHNQNRLGINEHAKAAAKHHRHYDKSKCPN
ncbi:hypothetical protein H744_2c3021 [Photobacterium gaetbulicola Gung47]|uniref:Uncharacterized protein n=1 Tax=Photobacterium gaetbulicola Gung47 TaxID=658445 RepID=A0A0C5WTE0_9GAMM|nr:hypothetical protein H744_2c3021 [Photobacterium gaetbulicola Gung47]